MKPALIAVMLVLATTAYADDLEKYCPAITEIYGQCSPELVANWLAHQNDTYIRPHPILPDAKPEAIASSTLSQNETLNGTPAQNGSAGTVEAPAVPPSSPAGASPTLNYTMFYVPVNKSEPSEKNESGNGGLIKVELRKDGGTNMPEITEREESESSFPVWLFATLVIPAGMVFVNLRKG